STVWPWSPTTIPAPDRPTTGEEMSSALAPPTTVESPGIRRLRQEVRDFLSAEISAGTLTPWIDTWLTRWDEGFTRRLAERGWIGMTIPVEYGGQGRTHLERFAITEELLAVGAPVAAQWVADRQIAPSLLRYGTEEQKQEFLPRIAAGECCFGIGMSEPDSGSDLASVRTKGVRVDGGWTVTGTKVWTSGALHFNAVVLDEVFVPDSRVFGTPGNGWEQVNAELAFERSGPERFLSSFRLLAAEIDAIHRGRLPERTDLGRSVARMAGLHTLSRNIAGALQRGEKADTAAALVKLLGTTTEGDIVDDVSARLGDETPGPPTEIDALLRAGLHQRPGFTLRGGTNEILRGVIARGLAMRCRPPPAPPPRPSTSPSTPISRAS